MGEEIAAGVELNKSKLDVFTKNHPEAVPLLRDVTDVDDLFAILSLYGQLDLIHCSPC